jgi:hypothetical protein
MGFAALSHHTNISDVVIPRYRCFDAVDRAVARIGYRKGIYCYTYEENL